MIMCVLLCYPVSIRIYYQQGVLFLVYIVLIYIVLQIYSMELLLLISSRAVL